MKALAAFLLGCLFMNANLALSGPPEELRINLQGKSLTATDISRLASRQLGYPLVYVPGDPRARLDLDLRNLSQADLPAVLAKTGTVAIASEEVTSGTALTGLRITLRTENAEISKVADALRQVSAGRFQLAPRDAHERVSFDCKALSVTRLASILALFGQTRLEP